MGASFQKKTQWLSWGITLIGLLATVSFLHGRSSINADNVHYVFTYLMILLWIAALFVGMGTIVRSGKEEKTQIIQGLIMVILANAVMLINAVVPGQVSSATASSETGPIPDDTLIALVKDHGDIVAARVLSRRVVPESRALFEDILASAERPAQLRAIAASALGGLGFPEESDVGTESMTFRVLIAGLEDHAPGIPEACAGALAWIGNEEAIAPILAVVSNQDISNEVRIAMVQALGKIGTAKSRNAIQGALEKEPAEGSDVAECCRRVLEQMPSAAKDEIPAASAPTGSKTDAPSGKTADEKVELNFH